MWHAVNIFRNKHHGFPGPSSVNLFVPQRRWLNKPCGGVFNEHYFLVRHLFPFKNPSQLSKKCFRFVNLRSVQDHQRMAIDDRPRGSWRSPGAVPWGMPLRRSLREAIAARMKKFCKEFSLYRCEDFLTFGKNRQKDREAVDETVGPVDPCRLPLGNPASPQGLAVLREFLPRFGSFSLPLGVITSAATKALY